MRRKQFGYHVSARGDFEAKKKKEEGHFAAKQNRLWRSIAR